MTHQLVNSHVLKMFKRSLKSTKQTKSTAFFTFGDISKLENSNVLTFTDCQVIDTKERLADIILLSTIAIDIETTGFNPRLCSIVGIGLSDGISHYYIPLIKDLTSEFKNSTKDFLTKLFDRSTRIIAHNAKFEYSFIKQFFNIEIPHSKVTDTMVTAYLLGFERKLSTLANTYLKRYPSDWKQLCRDNNLGEGDAYNLPLESIVPYCCEDAYECILLDRALKPYIDKYYSYSDILITDNLNTCTVADMELEGIKIDVSKVEPLLNYCNDLQEAYTDEFINLAGNEININSPAQLSHLIFDKLKLPTESIRKGKSDVYSVDKDTIKELEGLHPIIEVIQDYQLVKSVKRYLISGKENEKGLINLIDNNNFIYPNTNNCLTDTGRFSMSNPNLQQSPNPAKYFSLQNKNIAVLGQKFRELFIPRESNHRFIIADYPSFEFRILATLSKDETLIKVFNDSLDFHIIICENLFDVIYDKKSATHKLYRQVTKTINYGVAYGMTWIKLQREALKVGLNFSKSKCQRILKDYWKVLGGVYAFFCREKLKALKYGYSSTLWGRKRFYTFYNERLNSWVQDNLSGYDLMAENNETIKDIWLELEGENLFTSEDESKFRTIQNNPMQGTNADVVRYVLNEFNSEFREIERLTGGYCKVVLTVHDEFIIESCYKTIDIASKVVKDVMENSVNLNVPLPISPIICHSWAEGK